MSIRKANDTKLKVLPVVTACEHKYYYEGPCRFGKGEALEPGYDKISNAMRAKGFVAEINKINNGDLEVLDVVTIDRTDDWNNPEVNWDAASAAVQGADVAIISTSIAADDLAVEFCTRYDIPCIISPDSAASYTAVPAAVRASVVNEKRKIEVHSFLNWEQVSYMLKIMRGRKIIQNTKILCATRFGNPTSYSSVDSFNSYDAVTGRTGARFRFVNIHELFDQMTPAVEGGNPTTPGRVTNDLTAEDMALAEKMADELIAGANPDSDLEKDMLLKSLYAYITVQKKMDELDCCGFTAPCPDACSTRRLNEMKFTFCLTHSLNLEQGIPSCCEYDVSAVLSMQALIAVSKKCPYTGNTIPIKYMDTPDGPLAWVLGGTLEQTKKLIAMNRDNVYAMQHSIAHRRIHDPEKDSPYRLEHFAWDQKFGANIRYDFDADTGTKMTMCRFTPDGKGMFIAPGEVLMGDGYMVPNCSQVLYFRVNDIDDYYQKQCMAGNHVPMVFGDYVQELIDLCKLMGIEPIVAK